MLCPCPSERVKAHEVLRHPWICENGVATDQALDPSVLSRLKQFSAMNKLKKLALRVSILSTSLFSYIMIMHAIELHTSLVLCHIICLFWIRKCFDLWLHIYLAYYGG